MNMQAHLSICLCNKYQNLTIIWKNASFRNRENLQYKKTSDSVLLSLFMRLMESATIFTPPSTGLSGILISVVLLVLGCVPQLVVSLIADPGVDLGPYFRVD